MSHPDGIAIALSVQSQPPQSWRHWDDGAFIKIKVDGYVVKPKKLPIRMDCGDEMNWHFLFCERPASVSDFNLCKTEQGGLAAMGVRQRGHFRLFHLAEAEDLALEFRHVESLMTAADQGRKIVLHGRAIKYHSENPELADVFFDGWDNSSKCPCIVIDHIEYAKPEGLARLVGAVKPILKSIFSI